MMDGASNPYPIQLLVNYWECRPSLMGARLDALLRSGITHIATFVPWQAVESDIAHTLARFLNAVADRKMTVSLILTPEVGVHYPNSGLPKDIFNKPENIAQHAHCGPVTVCLPPNAFHLPSLSAPEFSKRYHNFLARMDGLLADLAKAQPRLYDCVTAVLTGGFWKYYREPRFSASLAFGGPAGDYSSCAAMAYRQRLEQFYGQKEFADPHPSSANRWKTQAMEDVNRRWFNQHCEDVFRSRSAHFVRRKAKDLPVRHIELFTPESDPGFSYSNFLQLICRGNGDFGRLSSLLDQVALRAGHVEADAAPSFVHWTGFGPFKTLSDAEKQFLILKSLLLLGGRNGGLLVDEEDWFSLSQVFRTRAEALARAISQNELRLPTRALYLAPHLWSDSGTLWDELAQKVGPGARMVSSIEQVLADADNRLLVVDPMMVLTRERIEKLTGWARTGRVLAVPRSPLFTESARGELEQQMSGPGGMDIRLGISYRIQPMGDGKVVLYDLPEGLSMKGEAFSAWQSFIASMLSLAGIEPVCSTSDGRLRLIPLQKRDGGMGLFVLNGSGRAVSADILFRADVTISDLTASFAADRQGREAVPPANRFALEVPPCGILPLSVDGLGDEADERRAAALTSQLLQNQVLEAAANELPGFSLGEGIDQTWS